MEGVLTDNNETIPQATASHALQTDQIPYTEGNNTNTCHENTFTIDNHLDSFVTSSKEEQSQHSPVKDPNETIHSNLNITPKNINTCNSNTNIFSELQNENQIETIQTPNHLNTKDNEEDEDDDEDAQQPQDLNDSLEDENDFVYSKSKSYYVSDFPLSSMKKDKDKENVRESLISNQELNSIKSNSQRNTYNCLLKYNNNNNNNNNVNLNNTSLRNINNNNNNSSINNNTNINNTNISNGIDHTYHTVNNENDLDNIYKKLIIAKRLNFANSKLSYHHNKNTTNPQMLQQQQQQTQQQMQLSSNKFGTFTNHITNTIINNTCIHNSDMNTNKLTSYLNSTCSKLNQNLTDMEMSPFSHKALNKSGGGGSGNNMNSNGQICSTYSTQPQTNKLNSLRNRKKFQSQTYENDDVYGGVSEFTIHKANSGYSKYDIDKLKKWLTNIELSQYLNCFIEHELTDLSYLVNAMKTYESKLKYEDIESIGIKKPGSIYRILTKLEIDSGLIDAKVTQFVLPYNKIGMINSIEQSSNNRFNLKISSEYCCGCVSASNCEVKNDLKMWLRKHNLVSYLPNFSHNGFDNLEFVVLQMYSSNPISDEVLENAFHIYDEDQRKEVLECLVNEMKKINMFVNCREFNDNPYKYKYLTMQLENNDEIDQDKMKKECNACMLF